MDVKNFRTKTIFQKRQHPCPDDMWIIAPDIGYSSNKVFAPNGFYVFPSYAQKIDSEQIGLGGINKNEILYHDLNSDELWCVGASAQNMITLEDSGESFASLYGRNRYFSNIFQIVMKVGLALGLQANEFGDPKGKKLHVQTGLPPAYLKSDEPLLREAMCGHHNFEIRIGNGPWQKFDFVLEPSQISFLPQPLGTYFSIVTNNNGNFVQDSNRLFKQKTLIVDPGFSTFDTFLISNGNIISYETVDTLGMKDVLKRTADKIFANYNVQIPVPAMQKYLEEGRIRSMDRRTHSTKFVTFEKELEEASTFICNQAIEKLDVIYNDLLEVDNLVLSGGTGAAWKDKIMNHYKDMETLTKIPGNQNDNIPYILTNARGYYLYAYMKLSQQPR